MKYGKVRHNKNRADICKKSSYYSADYIFSGNFQRKGISFHPRQIGLKGFCDSGLEKPLNSFPVVDSIKCQLCCLIFTAKCKFKLLDLS